MRANNYFPAGTEYTVGVFETETSIIFKKVSEAKKTEEDQRKSLRIERINKHKQYHTQTQKTINQTKLAPPLGDGRGEINQLKLKLQLSLKL